MSQRPSQLPEMIVSHAGASQAMSTPSRLAISVATSMSNPSYSFVCLFSSDCGGYAGSVETVSTPLSSIEASRSLPLSSPPPQAASPRASPSIVTQSAPQEVVSTSVLPWNAGRGGFGPACRAHSISSAAYYGARRPCLVMPEVGVEPTRPEGHGILSPARLPVPPLRRGYDRSPAIRRRRARRHTTREARS